MIEPTDREGRTALHYAANDGDLGTVQELIISGAEVGRTDRHGWTPLHFAAQAQAESVAKALLAAGAGVDAADADGNTPLSRAVFSSRGNGSLIKLLRSHGADPQRINRHGQSPAGLARLIANYDVAQYFADLEV